VSVGRLLAAKARAWSLVVAGTALLAFAGLSLGAPPGGAGAWLEGAALVGVGALGMTWLAIALAARAADLSDEQSPAVGPGTIYTFLLVGGLYNVMLAGDAATRARGLGLYAFAIAATWLAGVEQATVCLDAEAARARRVVLADGATLLIVLTLGQRGAAAAARLAAADSPQGGVLARLVVAGGVGLVTLSYLWRRPLALPRRGWRWSALFGLAAGLGGGALLWLSGATGSSGVDVSALTREPLALGLALLLLLADELLFRGLIQRGIEETWARFVPGAGGGRRAASVGAVGSVLLALLAIAGAGGPGVGTLIVLHGAAALARAATGRVTAAWLARVAALGVAVATAHG
jgi:hypothetical protein